MGASLHQAPGCHALTRAPTTPGLADLRDRRGRPDHRLPGPGPGRGAALALQAHCDGEPAHGRAARPGPPRPPLRRTEIRAPGGRRTIRVRGRRRWLPSRAGRGARGASRALRDQRLASCPAGTPVSSGCCSVRSRSSSVQPPNCSLTSDRRHRTIRLATSPGFVRPFAIEAPPYCPEANRIERVWLDLHAVLCQDSLGGGMVVEMMALVVSAHSSALRREGNSACPR